MMMLLGKSSFSTSLGTTASSFLFISLRRLVSLMLEVFNNVGILLVLLLVSVCMWVRM